MKNEKILSSVINENGNLEINLRLSEKKIIKEIEKGITSEMINEIKSDVIGEFKDVIQEKASEIGNRLANEIVEGYKMTFKQELKKHINESKINANKRTLKARAIRSKDELQKPKNQNCNVKKKRKAI